MRRNTEAIMINFSAELYLLVTGFAQTTPAWVRTTADIGTDAGLLLFAALFAWNGYLKRDRLSLLAPLAVIGEYLVSEVAKTFIQEERPCRAVAGAVAIAECPTFGDWSFPSNHATIAAACAAVLTVIWRQVGVVVFPLAALMACSRVFVGVHYPHDVAAGFLIGVTVGTLLTFALARVLTGSPAPAAASR
jgi:membrane-associated phospholipid phosphatase